MPPEAVLTAPKDIDFIGQMFFYFTLGAILHVVITVPFCFFVSLIDSVRNNYRVRNQLSPISFPFTITSQVVLFSFLLFLWGFPGCLLFLTTVTNKLYIQGDPLLDWHPLLPRGCSIFSPSFAGRLINGTTCNTLRLAWLLVAIPVWVASFLSYRCLLAQWKKTK